MQPRLSIKDLDLKGKKVLARVDFNVPLDDRGAIRDNSRILAALPTLRYVLDHGGSLIILSHMGRPKGKVDPSASLAVCVKELEKQLNTKVRFLSDCVGEEVAAAAKNLKPKEVLLLENLRFHAAEEDPAKDPTFAAALSALGDCYVDDAFGAAHRAHASITEIPKHFPKLSAQGFLMEQEVDVLDQLLEHPKTPFAALLGGAKASDKIPVLQALVKRLDILIIGGAMAFTFLRAQGYKIGGSLYEQDCLQLAQEIMDACKAKNIQLLLPVDVLVVPKQTPLNPKAARVASMQEGIADTDQGVDIGPATIDLFSQAIKKAATVFWNGPMGIFETPEFAKGTMAMAEAVAAIKGFSVVGGGDSLAAVHMAGVEAKISHLSTGGGASLEYLEHGHLAGVDALSPASTS